MENLKETFMKKYGIWEYLLFLGGALLFSRIIFLYMTGVFDDAKPVDLIVHGIVLLLSILMFALPLTILDLARKKAGMLTRSEKLNKKE